MTPTTDSVRDSTRSNRLFASNRIFSVADFVWLVRGTWEDDMNSPILDVLMIRFEDHAKLW